MIQNNEKVTRLDLQSLTRQKGYNYAHSPTTRSISLTIIDTLNQFEFSAQGGSHNKIDINKCGYYDFEALPGIGPALAQAIIVYRDSVGRFESIQDIEKIKGIGPAKFNAIKDRVIVQ